LKAGGTIVEATAGNTGIGLTFMANSLGYKSYFVIPDKMAVEKVELLRTLGATVEVVPTVAIDHPQHCSKVAEERAREINGGFYVSQFDNPNNWRAHYETTGPEIWDQTGGKLDAVVFAAGTGGTLAGISRFLKEKNKNILVYTIDPPGSAVMYVAEGGKIVKHLKTKEQKEMEGSSLLEGVGSPKVFHNLDQAIVDGAFRGEDHLAVEMAHFLLKQEGLFVGGSSGLNVLGAVYMACKLGPGHTIVTAVCEGGINYRKKMFDNKWLKENNISIGRTQASDFVTAYDSSKISASL